MKNLKIILALCSVILVTACGEKSDGNQNSNSNKEQVATKDEIEKFSNMGFCMGSVTKGMSDGVELKDIANKYIKEIGTVNEKRAIGATYGKLIDECSAKIATKKDWASVQESNEAHLACISNAIPNELDRAFMINFVKGYVRIASDSTVDQKKMTISMVCADVPKSTESISNTGKTDAVATENGKFKSKNFTIVFSCEDSTGAGINLSLSQQLMSTLIQDPNAYSSVMSSSTYMQYCKPQSINMTNLDLLNNGELVKQINGKEFILIKQGPTATFGVIGSM
jgi:hypothetical protein